MAHVINKDEVITCPGCQNEIARLKKPFTIGTFKSLDLFDWSDVPYNYGDETTCDKCGAFWTEGGHLHIKNKGWQPRP